MSAEIAENLWDCVVEELIAEVACEIHREVKLGKWSRSPLSTNFKCVCPHPHGDPIQDLETHDLLGHKLGVPMNQTFPCVHCGRSVAATRYAPHLEKCMGFGRNSSRIANQKLASYKNQTSDIPLKRSRDFFTEEEEEEYDEDHYDETFY